MTDIVERLRTLAALERKDGAPVSLSRALHLDAAASEIERLQAIIAAAQAAWQPIETAPKDGTEFLWCDEGKYCVIRWPEYELCFQTGRWISLPSAQCGEG